MNGADAGRSDARIDVRRRAVRIRIDLDAVRRNLDLARRLANGARAFAVVKADAYGHGALELARALDAADGFAVVGLGEAEALRAGGIRRPILVMQGPHARGDAARFAELGLWPAVHRPEQHRWLADAGARAGREIEAWLKVDTGMGRLGVMPEEVPALLGASGVAWVGVMSHLASADAPGSADVREQIRRLEALDLPGTLARSLANSAAAVAWPGTGHDWIRPGIMLYGANPLDGAALPEGVELAPAMTVTAPLISVKVLPRGHRVGYSGTYACPEDMPVGHVAIGYADGLPRGLEVGEGAQARADVSIGGRRCPLVGRVSMDSIAIDLRPAPDARIGDEAVIWGPGQPVERLARAAGTIPYELLTGIRGERRWDG